nr:HNH endonuclease signature motif containing protein [Bradyrhizobium elkanii]
MTLYSHRLCCEAFHGPSPSDKREVAHWDGNPSNNHFSNLRWASASENGLDRVRHGRKRGAMKLANEQVLRIKSIDRCAHAQRNSLARELGISQSWAWKIANGKWWRHLNSQG